MIYRESQWIQIKLVINISIIMGVTWMLDVISFVVYKLETRESTSTTVQLILDIVNLLAGVLIFIVLVCKRSILEKIKDQLKLKTNSESLSTLRQSMQMT